MIGYFITIICFIIVASTFRQGKDNHLAEFFAVFGGIVLFITIIGDPNFPSIPVFRQVFMYLGRTAGVLGPALTLLIGLSALSSAFSVYITERKRRALIPVLIIGGVLTASALVSIYGLLKGEFYFRRFVEVPYFVMAYFSIYYFYYLFVSFRLNNKEPSYHYDFIIVLGAAVTADGKVGNTLKYRLNRAFDLYKEQFKRSAKAAKIIVSGGHSQEDRLSEAEIMAEYLMGIGCPEKTILMETKAKNTRENLRFSKVIIGQTSAVQKPPIAIVTSDFHLLRSYSYAKEEQLTNFEMVGAKTNPKSWLFHQMRDFVAFITMHAKFHLMMTSIALLMGIISSYHY